MLEANKGKKCAAHQNFFILMVFECMKELWCFFLVVGRVFA